MFLVADIRSRHHGEGVVVVVNLAQERDSPRREDEVPETHTGATQHSLDWSSRKPADLRWAPRLSSVQDLKRLKDASTILSVVVRMQSHGESRDEVSGARQAVSRRSCNQCRARKIRCDRLTPCSNCISAKLDCIHSRIASVAVKNTKQRTLISTEYEQKVDSIARELGNIKTLLQSTLGNVSGSVSSIKFVPEKPTWHDDKHDLHTVATHPWINAAERGQRSSPSKITDIVRSVVRDIESGIIVSDEDRTPALLKKFLQTVDGRSERRIPPTLARSRCAREQVEVSLPPFDVAITALRWASAYDDDAQTGWMCHILPGEMFREACQRVYFAIDDYDEADFILANGYLAFVLAEYSYTTQTEEYQSHSELCRRNLLDAMVRLPVYTLPSLKTAAALALSAFCAIESSQALMAWNFISVAMNMCQTLGFHRSPVYDNELQTMHDAQSRLFWIVYRLERSLSLRFNRSSNIRDSEITRRELPASMRHIRLGRIHGKIYDLIYSPSALAEANRHVKDDVAKLLAAELQQMIQEMKDQLRHASPEDLMKKIHLLCDLICQSSMLTLVLRAADPPPPQTSSSGVSSDQCTATAREVLDMHQQCMAIIKSCNNHDPRRVIIYANWNLVHVPFVPFVILFDRAIQLADTSDLALLERFTDSLREEMMASPSYDTSKTHTFEIYEILYQTARLHILSRQRHVTATQPTVYRNLDGPVPPDFDFAQQLRADAAGFLQPTQSLSSSPFDTTAPFDLGTTNWYFDTQDLMSLWTTI